MRGQIMAWTIEFTGKAQKQYEKLPAKIRLIVAALRAELENQRALSAGVAAFREAQR
jgi:mRNA-degrading endonuclease RelE of RelBE toxin-antitoxin system